MTTYIATFYRPNGKVCKRTIEAPDYNNAEEQAQQMGAAMPLQVRAKARVKVMEEIGKHCLHEIKGLKEGDEVEGLYTPLNKAFDFTWHGEDAMLWIGCNAEIIL